MEEDEKAFNGSIALLFMSSKIVVYTSGTFEIFHSNHLKMIEYARGLGDTLIVGVSTDVRCYSLRLEHRVH